MAANPWYREPWPWLLMSGPAIVVVAGTVTAAIAVATFDGLVSDDYYKQGLAINRTLARDANARALGLSGFAQFAEERTRVRVVLGSGPRPPALRLLLVHPTRPGEDQSIALAATAPGVYEGAMRVPRPGVLHVRLEDSDGHWRLGGNWTTRENGVRLAPQ